MNCFALLFAAVLLSPCDHIPRANPPTSSTAVSAMSVSSRPASLSLQVVSTLEVQPVIAQTVPLGVVSTRNPAKGVRQEAKPLEPREVEETAKRFDLQMLAQKLKQTRAIGVFTKLAINSDATDLIEAVKKYRKLGTLGAKRGEIRSRFDGLLMKILALLEGDPQLARDIYTARERIWSSLLGIAS